METWRRKNTDVHEFARKLILSKEYQSTLRRRVLAGQINRDFAKTLLDYARNPEGQCPEALWLGEPQAIRRLERMSKDSPREQENDT